jgi:hypothetical protein
LVTTLKAETVKVAAMRGWGVGDDGATVCHFSGSAAEVGFPDDCKRKALATWRALLSFMPPLAAVGTEAFEERLNRR